MFLATLVATLALRQNLLGSSKKFRDNLEKVKNIYQDEFEKLKEENEAEKRKSAKQAIENVKEKVRRDAEKEKVDEESKRQEYSRIVRSNARGISAAPIIVSIGEALRASLSDDLGMRVICGSNLANRC